MKKFLLSLLGGALFCLPTLAQEEDVTHLITNAGFDEDLTFQIDGTMKEAISTTTSLSGRSWAYIAADSTVYARPTETSSQSRPDGRKLEAVNGFKGRVAGWTLESNSAFPNCEWTYFGTVPYDLQSQAVPIADDGTTYLEVPARPTEFDGGVGFVYLRAGWTNSAIYKQVVSLPCAKYRLEYWTININPNTTAVAADLTQIVCRKDVFKDEEGTGLSAQEWTKHEFEFTPTAEFTMQFGYQAANAGSGGQPIVALDGIKLYKIGEADAAQLLRSDLNDLSEQCQQMANEANQNGFVGLGAQIDEYSMVTIDDFLSSDEPEELEAALKIVNAKVAEFKKALEEMANVDAILAKMDELLKDTDFGGKEEFDEAYRKILSYKDEEEQEDAMAAIMGAVEEATAAIKAYYLTQKGSVDEPADFTIFIQNPWFINASAEPKLEDGVWKFPNDTEDEEGNKNYTVGSASSPDLNSTGWYIAGAEGGDQRLNWQQGRSCWNAWNNNFTTTIAVAQDIEGLPNGYYTVSADLITQSRYANGTQRVFAESIAEKKLSTEALKTEGWNDDTSLAEWETVSMTADDKVLVVDGKLTIGAEGTGDGSASAGWFLATNFHLYYLGEAPADAVKQALDAKVAAANELADAMHFAVDKKALQDSIAKFATEEDYVVALAGLTAAMTEADKSQAKYEEFIPSDGTVDGKTIPTVQATLKSNGGEGYGAAEAIVQFAYDYTQNWIKCDTATYTKFDAVVDQLKNYLNTYTPVYNQADEVAASSSEAGKAALQAMMEEQKAALVAEMQPIETINGYIEKLNNMIAMVEKRNIYDNPDATDYTAFIQNPKLQAETGWEFDKGNGNNNTTSGQWYDGSNTRYIDSYNSNGLQGFIAQQLITDLPNGTYTVGVYTRTPAEGAYIFNAPAGEKKFVEIPLDYHQDYTEAGEDTLVVASDQFGPIWEDAKQKVEVDGIYDDEILAIYNANSGNGRGWKHQTMEGIVVTNHELLIGTAAGSEALGTEKTFGGAWYSVGGWTLTLTAKGDNSGWDGPVISGIENVTVAKVADGIYSLTGVKTAKMQRGLNIVITDGKARKVIVK